MRRGFFAASLLMCAAAISAPGAANAGPIPPGWSCTGGCGTDGADGDIPLSPLGNPYYEYVTTTNGVDGAGQNPVTPPTGPTDGSLLTTQTFTVTANSSLSYYFDFITSDGGQFADNVWAVLFAAGGTPVAELYNDTTAQTPVNPGTTVSWLGAWSGQCFQAGCGNTGWQQINYTILNAGSYYIEFGATNAYDELFDTGMGIDGVEVNGHQINPVPEPEPIILLVSALAGLGMMTRRRKKSA